jgi:hypothetical protein
VPWSLVLFSPFVLFSSPSLVPFSSFRPLQPNRRNKEKKKKRRRRIRVRVCSIEEGIEEEE